MEETAPSCCVSGVALSSPHPRLYGGAPAPPKEVPFPQSRRARPESHPCPARGSVGKHTKHHPGGRRKRVPGYRGGAKEKRRAAGGTYSDCRLGRSPRASAGMPRSWLFCSILQGKEKICRAPPHARLPQLLSPQGSPTRFRQGGLRLPEMGQ